MRSLFIIFFLSLAEHALHKKTTLEKKKKKRFCQSWRASDLSDQKTSAIFQRDRESERERRNWSCAFVIGKAITTFFHLHCI